MNSLVHKSVIYRMTPRQRLTLDKGQLRQEPATGARDHEDDDKNESDNGNEVEPKPIIAYDMFSPENLEKLIESYRRSESCCSDSEDEREREVPLDVHCTLDTRGNFVIPIELDLNQDEGPVMASGKLKLMIKFDTGALLEASKIKDRYDRIHKIKELIQLEPPVCELCLL